MSTQSVGPVVDLSPSRRSWDFADLRVVACTTAVGMFVATRWVHRDTRSLVLFAAFGIALPLVTVIAQMFYRQPDSPLDIDRTVRKLRTVTAAAALLVAYVMVCTTAHGIAIPALVGCSSAGLVTLSTGRRYRSDAWYAPCKSAVDRSLALLLITALSPIWLVIASAIKFDSRGKVFFTQERIGEDGSSFLIYKFRSMRSDAPEYARSPSNSRDPRITRVGRILRRAGIDEFPQLLNVVRGEMSLVGPRPEMPFLVRTYTAKERMRLKARPGITGLWQISPARAFPIHENLQYDLYYITHKSLMLDLAIICRTFFAVLRGVGAV